MFVRAITISTAIDDGTESSPIDEMCNQVPWRKRLTWLNGVEVNRMACELRCRSIPSIWTASCVRRRRDYERALAEIRKRPQAVALDVVHLPAVRRARAECNVAALCNQILAEARAYLAHPMLGPRLLAKSPKRC